MAEYLVKQLDALPGEFGGGWKMIRSEMGLSSFGIQLWEMGPDQDSPTHNEAESGQEELYWCMGGSGALDIGGDEVSLRDGTLVKVDPAPDRTLHSGPEGMTMLIVGAVPGGVYEVQEWTETAKGA